MGRLGATDQENHDATKLTTMLRIIQTRFIPKATDTRVGECGVQLRCGQKPRIAIVHAFLKISPLLLLHEARSALDTVTERRA